jgi:hypothetical protein
MANREPARSALEFAEGDESRDFAELIAVPIGDDSHPRTQAIEGIVVGTLVGLTQNGATPLVTFPGQPGTAPIAARTTVDVYAPHIGRNVVLVFEAGNPDRPIITGCIRQTDGRSVPDVPGRVEAEADGERLVVSALHGVVLRCGKASISLSPDGKIVLRGTHVVSHSSGLNRIKGGSVQVN